jgi:DNA-binding transcriptional regulator YhcF (GntR family)
LELLGFLETQRGRGTFVCTNLPQPSTGQQLDGVRASARELLSRGYMAGLNYADVLKILEEERK